MEFEETMESGFVRWSPDGRALAFGFQDQVKIFDAGDGYAEEEARLHAEQSANQSSSD